jgi:lipopolysaccharide export system permease protein
MIGRTLGLYFAGRFVWTVLAFFGLFVFLLAAVGYFDLLRRAFTSDDFDIANAALVVLLRLPSDAEETLPFAMLFGAMAAFVMANRRLEVVVARAAGLSAWQFLLPAALAGLLMGVVVVTIYTPISSLMTARASAIQKSSFMDLGQVLGRGDGPLWLRQTTGDRESIVGAEKSFDKGLGLNQATAFVYDLQGKFIERVDAPRARFSGTGWQFSDATVTRPAAPPENVATYSLPSALSPEQIGQTFEVPRNVSFWQLPGIIRGAERSGVPLGRYELRYYGLLALPILLLAMVLVAGIVSLRFSRSRNVGRMVLSGIGAGFVLYIFTSLARDLGSGGVVPPPLAAWLPAVAATLFGLTVLLHLEDG